MDRDTIVSTLNRLRSTFHSGKTRPYKWRISQLKQLRKLLIENEKEIITALTKDLGRCEFEGVVLEHIPLVTELDHVISHLSKWMEPNYTPVPVFMAPATSELQYDPFGVCLIISAFNYPLDVSCT